MKYFKHGKNLTNASVIYSINLNDFMKIFEELTSLTASVCDTRVNFLTPNCANSEYKNLELREILDNGN
jgi:hypothetical protein